MNNNSKSFQTMANAMLESDDFKSSHPDLTIWMDEERSSQLVDEHGNSRLGDNTTSRKQGEAPTTVNLATNTKRPSVTIQAPDMTYKRRKLSSDDCNGQPPPNAIRSTYELVHEISLSCAGRSDRMALLSMARDHLDHSFTQVHDDEIQQGVDVALVKQLVLLVFKLSLVKVHNSSNSHHNISGNALEDDLPSLQQEVCSALELLELVYRGSDAAVADSFRKCGPDLLHVLVTVLDEELGRRIPRQHGDDGSSTTSGHQEAAKQDPGKQEQEDARKEESVADSKPQASVSSNEEKKEDHPEQRQGARPLQEMPPLPHQIVSRAHTRSVTPPLAHYYNNPDGDMVLLKAIKVLGNLARVGKATKPMAFFPGMLRCILNLINFQPYESIPWEARLSALWILANLACNPSNMQMMMCTPGLVRSLVRIGCRSLHPDDPMEVKMEVLRSRSLSSRALLNLSWAPENKIPLSENTPLLELLCQLAVHRKAPHLNKSQTVREILHQTRCHAVGALRNLAAAPRRTKIFMVEYKQGHVLDILTDVALNDPDKSIQNRAFAGIHNLAHHDTAQRMVERPALVLALKDVLLEEEEQDKNQQAEGSETGGAVLLCKEGSPRSHASATLMVLERTITPQMDSYDNLRDLLEAINPTVPSDEDGDEMNPMTMDSVSV